MLHGWTRFVSMQDQYSLMYREEEREMFGLLADQGVGSIPYSPLAKGRLARPFGEHTKRFDNDPVGRAHFGDGDEAIISAVQQVAEGRGIPMAQVALAWVLRNPVVSAPIVGRDEVAPPRRRRRGARGRASPTTRSPRSRTPTRRARRWATERIRRTTMTDWTEDELERLGGAEELRIASLRPDGTQRPYVIIWVVRAGDDLYVRSAYGADNPWFRRAVASGIGRVKAGGLEPAVTLRAGRRRVDGCCRRGVPREVRPLRPRHRRDRGRARTRGRNTLRLVPRPE